jgi:hypothetical protein
VGVTRVHTTNGGGVNVGRGAAAPSVAHVKNPITPACAKMLAAVPPALRSRACLDSISLVNMMPSPALRCDAQSPV